MKTGESVIHLWPNDLCYGTLYCSVCMVTLLCSVHMVSLLYPVYLVTVTSQVHGLYVVFFV